MAAEVIPDGVYVRFGELAAESCIYLPGLGEVDAWAREHFHSHRELRYLSILDYAVTNPLDATLVRLMGEKEEETWSAAEPDGVINGIREIANASFDEAITSVERGEIKSLKSMMFWARRRLILGESLGRIDLSRCILNMLPEVESTAMLRGVELIQRRREGIVDIEESPAVYARNVWKNNIETLALAYLHDRRVEVPISDEMRRLAVTKDYKDKWDNSFKMPLGSYFLNKYVFLGRSESKGQNQIFQNRVSQFRKITTLDGLLALDKEFQKDGWIDPEWTEEKSTEILKEIGERSGLSTDEVVVLVD